MPRKHLSVVLSMAMAANLAAPTAGQATGEAYFYRYKTTLDRSEPPSEGQTKDIVAFFVGGVGIALDEKLPMKPEWEDDTWIVKKGTLPAGITFDAASRTFRGTPTTAVTKNELELEGFDKTGASVATALATFDIFSIQGNPYLVDLYAHTGKYKLDQLPLPDKTIEDWTRVYAPPSGIQIIGRNLDGVPSKAGVYPVFLQGRDYLGNVVATYFGKYTVEDGPTFPLIPDAISKLPQLELQLALGPYNFGAPSPYAVNHAINPAKEVRYFAEIKEGDDLPYGISLDDNPLDTRFRGYIGRPYDTATIRFKAIDSDDTIGYSNWFTFGSSDPQPGCYPYPVGILTTYTGIQSTIGIPRPIGAQGELRYELVSGVLPDGLELEAANGLITGIPLKAEAARNITVDVNVINDGGTTKTSCTYSIESRNGSLSVADATRTQAKHVRIGATYTGVAAISGGIADWTTAFTDTHEGLSIVGDTNNATAVNVTGSLTTKGLPHTVGLTVSNGDGNSQSGQLAIYAHDPLAFSSIPVLQAKRLAASTVIGSVPYDAETVINDYSGAVNYPIITLDHPERLPSGISFDGRNFVGATSEPAGTYGPFRATMTDFTGETEESAEFSLTVAARDEIAIASVTEPTFIIRQPSETRRVPVAVKQPPGADGFAISWTIDGYLPEWLSFNADSGALTARADLQFTLKGTYGPFTVTATDSEGSTATSSPFNVTVADLPEPALSNVVPATIGNVSGDPSKGESVTFVQTPAIRNLILADTVVGGQAGVTFTLQDPENPAGLTFNPADGSFAGEPVSEFNSDVVVTFEDKDGRTGAARVPLQIKPYPKIAMEQGAYDLQRLADAASIKGAALDGFWGTPVWGLEQGNLPDGVIVGSGGTLIGKTSAAEGSIFQDIILKARDSSTGLTAKTQPFSINIKAKGAYTVSYSGTDIFYLNDKTDTSPYAVASHNAAAPSLSGAALSPLNYSIASSDKELPDGLTVNPLTGVASFTGTPSLGKWNLKIAVTDADGQSATQLTGLNIWSTLAGSIKQPSVADAPGMGDANTLGSGNSYVLRVGEPFNVKPIKATNAVGDVTFNATPPALYPGLDFSGATGAFSDDSHFESSGNYTISVGATDADGRTMPPLIFSFQIVPPLDLKAAQTVFQGKQFQAGSVDAKFQAATNVLGDVTYRIKGDDVPGTLTYAVYDDQDQLVGYNWVDIDAKTHELAIDATRKVSGYRIGGVPQALYETKIAADYFALDALVFDPVDLTLKGTPSKAGTFPLTLVATDDHMSNYIKDVAGRTDNNQAEVTFTVISTAAEPLQIANATKDGVSSTDSINLFTSQSTLVTTVSNAAYGRPVTWTQVAGTLPAGVFAAKSVSTLGYSGYPEATGTYSDIRWRAKDAAGRTIESAAASLIVGLRLPLALEASSNPKGMVVNSTDADLTVTAKNTSYGADIDASKWTVSGTLPPGITYTVSDGNVRFTGQATVIGTYPNIVVTGMDSKGTTASVTLTFKVISPTDAIGLSASNLTTKAGYPLTIQATATNTYGAVRFYSNDITSKYAQELTIASGTGLIAGSFPTTQQANFDVYVTDETNRVTSKPVVVDVIPVLRIAAPTLVTMTQGSATAQSVDTFNHLGTVTFEKVGQWPDGITLDASTGAIGISGAATGTYSGLQIRGTDTFSGSQTDIQLSNAFSIKVEPIDALPLIATPAGKTLSTVGTANTAFTASVTDNVINKKWPGPLTFKANHDIAADTGMTFDVNTGTISGTPTKPVIYKDLVITATTERGDKASTQPFWFGVQPSGVITPDPAQQTHFVLRMDTDFSIGPFKFLNTYGVLTYVGNPTAADHSTGILGGKAPLPASWYTGPNGKWTGNYVTVTDEFGRKGTIEYSVTDVYGLTITPPGGLTFGAGEAATTSAAPAVANVYGSATFTAEGLPSWLTMNANGSVTGAAPAETAAGTYPISVTVKDSYDGVSKTVTYNVKVTDIKAYKVVFDTWHPHPTLPVCVGLSEFRVFSGSANITSSVNVVPSAADPAYPAQNLTDGVVSTASMWFITKAAPEMSITFKNVRGNKPTSIQWTHRADGYIPCNPTSWHIMATADDQTWETILSGSGAGAGGATVETPLP